MNWTKYYCGTGIQLITTLISTKQLQNLGRNHFPALEANDQETTSESTSHILQLDIERLNFYDIDTDFKLLGHWYQFCLFLFVLFDHHQYIVLI